jgi:hypothetical protein
VNDNYFRFPRPASAPQPEPRPVQWRFGYATVSHNGPEPILSKELQASINEAVRNHYANIDRAIFTAATETSPGITRDVLLEQLRRLSTEYPAIDPISIVFTQNMHLAQKMLMQGGYEYQEITVDFGPPLRPEPEPEQPAEPPQAALPVPDFITECKITPEQREELERRLQNGVTVAVRDWMPKDAMLVVSRSGAYQWVVNIGKGEIE